MKSKNKLIFAIALTIVGLLIASNATAFVNNSNKAVRRIEYNLTEKSITSKVTEVIPAQKYTSSEYDVCSYDPLFIGDHPTIANAGSTILLGFEDPEQGAIWFTASSNGGASWSEDALGWDLGYVTFPSIAYSTGSRFYGTMVPDWETSGEVTLCDFVDANDPDTWVAGTWDWEDYGIYGFESTSIASGPTDDVWKWGFITMSGYNGYNGASAEQCPYTMYSTGQDYATISWLISSETSDVLEGCVNPANSIDPVKEMNYGIWELYDEIEGFYNIEYRKDKFDYIEGGGSPFVGAGQLVTPENNRYPDICAYNNNVIIVSQTDVNGNDDIICYYSSDGLSNFDVSYVASTSGNEKYPKIIALNEDEAICTFVMDDNLYYSVTDDGGVTWGTPRQVNEDETVKEEYHTVDVCELGAAYSDEGPYVYYSPVGASPIITIESITGGMGVSTVIKNVGTADAADVPYSISITGGILGLVNKNVEDIIPTLAVGGEATVTSGIFIGLGPIQITVTADAAQETISATQLIIYTSV